MLSFIISCSFEGGSAISLCLLYRWKGERTVKLEGSDHAPVCASLLEIPDTSLHSTPSLSARYNPKIHGLQQTLGRKDFLIFGWSLYSVLNNIRTQCYIGVGIAVSLDCTFCTDALYLYIFCMCIDHAVINDMAYLCDSIYNFLQKSNGRKICYVGQVVHSPSILENQNLKSIPVEI